MIISVESGEMIHMLYLLCWLQAPHSSYLHALFIYLTDILSVCVHTRE